jgi:signal transduction histidine kinase
MVERVIGALQLDEAKALQMFIAGGPGFREADLYPYCGGPDGMFTAHPELMGQSLRSLRDKRGNAFGERLYAAAEEGEIAFVTYYWTRRGSTEILEKVALVTKIGDQVCAVGYYRPMRRGKEMVP